MLVLLRKSAWGLLWVCALSGCSEVTAPALPVLDAADSLTTDLAVPDVPCTSADSTCLGRIAVGTQGLTLPYFRTRSLDTVGPGYRRAVIVIHGINRDADKYYATMVGLAQAAGVLPYTIVVAPHFQTTPGVACSGVTDSPAEGELYWKCSDWKQGGSAQNDPQADSFSGLDAIIGALKRNFPALERITVAGHSAGGQTTQRYAAANRADRATASTPIPIRYVVANPSSFLYFDARRLTKAAVCSDPMQCMLDASSFVAPYYDAAACPSYNQYPYGLEQRSGYTASLLDAELRAQYVARSVVQLQGALDNAATSVAGYADLDVTCGGQAEGPFGQSFRLQRGFSYNAYAKLLGAQHPIYVVPGCGHSQDCMFKSPVSQAQIFGN